MRIVELGAGASGFQFMLSQLGVEVISVDPLENPSDSVDWVFTNRGFDHLNSVFGGKVKFIRNRIERAGLPEASVDCVFAISVLEHVPEEGIGSLVREVARILRPGGVLVATIDLFLDLWPFTEKKTNQFGSNISVRNLVEISGLQLMRGNRDELCGFDEFVPERIASRARGGEFYVSNGVACQGVVLVKREAE